MHAVYGVDLSIPGAIDRVTWRWLSSRVAALPADSAVANLLRARRKAGDVVADQVLETDGEADDFWRRRASRHLRGREPH